MLNYRKHRSFEKMAVIRMLILLSALLDVWPDVPLPCCAELSRLSGTRSFLKAPLGNASKLNPRRPSVLGSLAGLGRLFSSRPTVKPGDGDA